MGEGLARLEVLGLARAMLAAGITPDPDLLQISVGESALMLASQPPETDPASSDKSSSRMMIEETVRSEYVRMLASTQTLRGSLNTAVDLIESCLLSLIVILALGLLLVR